jgi:hypothetical protein
MQCPSREPSAPPEARRRGGISVAASCKRIAFGIFQATERVTCTQPVTSTVSLRGSSASSVDATE